MCRVALILFAVCFLVAVPFSYTVRLQAQKLPLRSGAVLLRT